MTDSVPTIRRAIVEDVPAISECVKAAYTPDTTRIGKPPGPIMEDYKEAVASRDVFVLVAENRVIGLLVLVRQEQNCLLDNVAVHPDYQGRGFGRKLIAFAEKQARDAGFDSITLYTNEQRTENIELYSKLGFVETERRNEQGYRRVYMQKAVM